MSVLKHHPGFSLRDDAAAALDHAEDVHGTITLNRAGVTEAEQQNLIDRWDKGGTANRPPYLYPPARPAKSSKHVKQIAADIANWRTFAVYAADEGFSHPYPGGDPVHFEFVGHGNTGLPDANPDVLNRQRAINAILHLGLVEDGRLGPLTIAGIKQLQHFFGIAEDGSWGSDTEAHYGAYVQAHASTPTPAAPSYSTVSIANVASIGDVRGLQKIARANGYKGAIDNDWGPGSQAGFSRFISRYGSVGNWLRQRWGYKGNDQLGPVMTAALQHANSENFRVL